MYVNKITLQLNSKRPSNAMQCNENENKNKNKG